MKNNQQISIWDQIHNNLIDQTIVERLVRDSKKVSNQKMEFSPIDEIIINQLTGKL